MAVEVFSLVTANISRSFLASVISTVGKHDSGVVEQLLSGMSSNLRCWRNDGDGSWNISGGLNSVVEAGANLLALYTRAQAAARENNSSVVDLPLTEPFSPITLAPFVTKVENLDADEDLALLGGSENIPPQEIAGQLRAASAKAEQSLEVRAGPMTRQSTRLAAHRRAYLSQKSYVCRTCKKSFSSSTNLRRHVRANHETNRFQCQYCPAAFKRCDSLLRHRRTTHADLQCADCRKVFKTLESKTSHACKGRSSDRLSCTVCRKSFISRSNLNKHIRLTHGATVFPCKECGKLFRQSDTLTLHTWKSHHRFICPHCGSVHETAKLLCRHMSSVHGKKVKGMTTPEKRSPSPENDDDDQMANLNDGSDADDDAGDSYVPDAEESDVKMTTNGETNNIDHDAGLLPPNGTPRQPKPKDRPPGKTPAGVTAGGRSNACHVCHKAFSSESNLRRHIRVNHEASRFPCQMCTAVFKRIDSLVRHKRANHAELCCTVCHVVFNSAEAKSAHNCMKPSEKKLSCDVCGKSFVNRSNLNKHTYLVHGGVKFHCSECPKFFRRSMTLTLHMWKFHNRFSCPQCSSVLETAALLCDHMTAVHGRKATKNLSEICRRPVARPIAVANCARCNKTFSSRSNLAKHVRVVHGHPRWHCHMCERTFTAEIQLSLHVRTFHQHLPLKSVRLLAIGVATLPPPLFGELENCWRKVGKKAKWLGRLGGE